MRCLGNGRACMTAGVGLIAMVAAAPVGAVTIHYIEEFPNATTLNQPFNSVGWSAHRGSTATDITSDGTNALVSSLAGPDGASGYAARNHMGSGVVLVWTNEAAFAPISVTQIESITFLSNNSITADAFRIAIRLDGGTPGNVADDTWHATNAGFIRNSATAGTAANWPTNAETESLAFTLNASAWRDLNFTAGSSLSLATSARSSDLPSGVSVNAVGLYLSDSTNVNTGPSTTASDTMRFDRFTVNAVPEPGICGAAVGVAGLLLRHRRRTRPAQYSN